MYNLFDKYYERFKRFCTEWDEPSMPEEEKPQEAVSEPEEEPAFPDGYASSEPGTIKMGSYFTVDELCHSVKASLLGIDNTPSEAVKRNLQALIDNVLDPLRRAYGKPIIVNSGYRCTALNLAVGGVPNSQHCFDELTEILTMDGWKTYKTIDEEDSVFTYNIGNGEVEILPIDDIIIREHKGRMVHMESACIDIMVTDKHRMLVRYPTHKYVRRNTKNITPQGQAYFDSLKTENYKYHIELATDVFGKRRIYKCAAHYNGQNVPDIELLRFAIAFVCDGYWCKKNSSIAMGFRFKKERKVERLIQLADDLGWPYALHKDNKGVYNFYFRTRYARQIFDIVGENKILPKWLMTLNDRQALDLINCFADFDGHYDDRDTERRITMCTTIKQNADVLQAMCVLSGIKCQMSVKESRIYHINGMSGIAKDVYILTTCNKSETIASERCYKWEDYDGIVWCVNNANTTLITRRNGKVAIQGNCTGHAADITGGNKTENKKLWELIKKLNLPIDQCIDESSLTWIHVSYDPTRNRHQFLKL